MTPITPNPNFEYPITILPEMVLETGHVPISPAHYGQTFIDQTILPIAEVDCRIPHLVLRLSPVGSARPNPAVIEGEIQHLTLLLSEIERSFGGTGLTPFDAPGPNGAVVVTLIAKTRDGAETRLRQIVDAMNQPPTESARSPATMVAVWRAGLADRFGVAVALSA